VTPEQEAALAELRRRGMTPEQEAAALELVRRSEGQQMTTPAQVTEQKASPMPERTTLDDLLIGIGRGYQDTLSGLKDLALWAAEIQARGHFGGGGDLAQRVMDAREQAVAQDQREQRAFAEGPGQSSPVASTVGRVVGNIASLPLPGTQGRSLAARAGESAGLGAVEGFVQPAATDEERLRNTLVGGATGGAVQGAGELAINAVPRRAGEAEDVIALGDQFGVDVFADDVIDSKSLRVGVDSMSQIPVVGTAGGKGVQNRAQAQAAADLTERYTPNFGGDSDGIFGEMQAGMQRRLETLKNASNSRYAAVGAQLDPAGPIELEGFRELAAELIAKEEARGSRANRDLISTLESFRDAPEDNFTAMIRLRSDLGEEIGKFYQGKTETLPKRGVEFFQQLKDRLTDDMTEFASGVSDDALRGWEGANRFYAQRIAPFRETALRRLVNTEEPERLLSFVIANSGRQGGTRSRAEQMYNALDTRGRGAVRAAILGRALEDAVSDGRAFSPQKFANRLDEIRNVVPVFFRGSAQREVEGFKRLMEHTSRSASYATQAPTGAMLLPALAVLGQTAEGTDSMMTTISVAASAAAMRALTQTRMGRNALLLASRAAPGSEDMSRAAKLAGSTVRRAIVRENTRSETAEDSQGADSQE